MVTFTTAGAVSPEDWDTFIDDLKAQPIKYVLGSSIGIPTITSVQRKLLADVMRSRHITLAALTDERMVRGVATMLSWFGVDLKAFSWGEVREALSYLNVAAARQDSIVTRLEQLRQQVLRMT